MLSGDFVNNIQFEPVLTLGTIIQTVVFVGTIIVAYSRFVARMAKLETKLNILWSVFQRKLGADMRDEDEKYFQN